MRSYYTDRSTMSIADVSEAGLFGPATYYINRINVPRGYRGKGIATTLLKAILADADREGVTLVLEISPSDGLTYDQLKAWYARHGFETHHQLVEGVIPSANVMVRGPQMQRKTERPYVVGGS